MASSSRVSTSSSSSSSSSSSHRPSSYDVFINFRGVDTRKNFVSLLYKALIKDGIHVFIDSEELWEGEEICPSLLRAIRGSEISIPVFSKNYGDSKYCLLELAEIWECHLYEGQTILPIFIDVEPRDVRHQTGSFQGPFQEHQSKCESADVEIWRNALKEVGNLKGWTLKGDANIEDQSNLVELIVQRALRELISTPLDECKHPVGIDSHIDKLLSLLNIGNDDVRFVAICGMGGLGKTTIAKVVYNRIFRSFNGSSFLTDVRQEASQGNKGLVSLQTQLLKDICGKDKDYGISFFCQGSKLIARRLHREKILLILDDVDDYEQLDVLAGGINWFGQGSRVIITTRDDQCLNTHKVDKDIQIYKLEGLNFENSLKLFSLYAFLKNEPLENYKQFSHEIVQCAEGLPLTLEVLGSFLCDKDEEEWKNTVGGLNDILDNKVSGMSLKSYDDKVFARLMISYNKLGEYAKIIFLDIACHFAGWYAETPISIWEACELRPRLVIKELTEKHLLKMDNYRLKMHDQLRYLGRRIISKDSAGDPTKRTRLWSPDEILKILKKDMVTQMVEGLLLATEEDLSWEDFAKMPNLRFLNVCGTNNLKGDFSHLSSKLRWFRWCCPLTILPANFYHEELVYLDLSSSHIKLAWNDVPQNKNKRFQKLKVLILTKCWGLSDSPDFSWFPCLERLDLSECRYLLELPDSICQMPSLKSLVLWNCESLNKLPTSIGDLKHLVEFSVSGTNIEELPDGVGRLEKLEELDVSWCFKLARLPTSMGRMRSLLHFYMKYTMIVKLPYDFSKLSSLEVLSMAMRGSAEKTIGMVDPEDDKTVYKRIQPFPITMSSFSSQLQKLYLNGYDNLESLPELPSTLAGLEVRNCISLQEIPGLSHLEWLKELSLYGCKSLVRLPDLSNLKRLKKLQIRHCDLEEIHGLEGTESLEELNVEYCYKLRELPDISNLKRLRRLNISGCKNLQEIHGLKGAESLEWLSMYDCDKLIETRRKIHGQGRHIDYVEETVLRERIFVCEGQRRSPILCVVFELSPSPLIWKGVEGSEKIDITFLIEACIHRGVKKIDYAISIRTEVEPTPGDLIYIHHFNGLLFESIDAIQILRLRGDKRIWPYYSTEVKFWTVMFENKLTDQQVPIQQSSASLVADFFRWSNVEDDEEGASTSRASNYRGASWPSSIEETGWLTRCQGLLREWILKTRVGRSIEGWVLERLPHNDDETSVDSGAL
ncbi:disease resistance protein RPV1-like [Macadamia integrifolia]|uniref:disease resistance protein RPV1-like n=1 Tax=Macadamia integrifolia TaxID=60698 RepID=UPI001C4EB800|nr:disease resistance protein RPV1-like [Macadamia integrifolia]